MRKTRWGILGTGSIAHQFARDLKRLESAEITAVGSRSRESADRFADEFDISVRHASYEALAADPTVDVVYVSTPHVFHKENTLLCLEHGKPVLCEKPFAVNTGEAEAMIAAATSRGLFLMEAMWTHFFPAMQELKRIVAAGDIGEVRMVRADFCFRCGVPPTHRLVNPALGGGGLLDVGVYTVAFAQLVMDREPVEITGAADIGSTGVDEQCALVLRYDTGALGVLTSAVKTSTPGAAVVYGTDGWVSVPDHFWKPDRLIVHRGNNDEERTFPLDGVQGFVYEAAHVGQCLSRGQRESDVMPHDKTMAIMRTLDAARANWNLRYPCEPVQQ